MGRCAIAVLAAGVALVASSARAQTEQGVLAPTVLASRGLPPNAITTFTVRCAVGQVATSAGVSSPGPGTTLLSLAPVGRGAYRFSFGNPASNDRRRVTVAVACRKVRGRAPSYVLRLKPLATKRVTVPPQGAAAATLACPAGTTPAGAGVDLARARQQSARAYRSGPPLSIRRETSTTRRFSFSVSNSGARPRTVAFHGSCVTLFSAAGAAPERLHVRITTFGVPLQPGEQTVTRRCPRGWFSLAAGFSLGSGQTSADGAVAVAGAGRWSLTSDADAPTTADVQLACGRLGR